MIKNKSDRKIRCGSCGTASKLKNIKVTESLWKWIGPEGWYCRQTLKPYRDHEYVCKRCVDLKLVDIDPWLPIVSI